MADTGIILLILATIVLYIIANPPKIRWKRLFEKWLRCLPTTDFNRINGRESNEKPNRGV